MEGGGDPRERAAGVNIRNDREKKTSSRLSGTIAAEWTAWRRGAESLRLFADYRAAFKPAAFDFGIGEGEAGGAEGLLDPETANTYEAGARTPLADGQPGLEASGFWLDFEELVPAPTVHRVPPLRQFGGERVKVLAS